MRNEIKNPMQYEWSIVYDYYHLGIRSSDNLPPKKTTPLYEGIGSIPDIFKIYVYVSLD